MAYKVTKQYGQNREANIGSFKDIKSAKAFIQEKAQEDNAMSVKAIYRLYEWDDLIEESEASSYAISSAQTGDSSQSQGRGAGSRPTPLSTVPRPAGMPQSWSGNEEDDKGKK